MHERAQKALEKLDSIGRTMLDNDRQHKRLEIFQQKLKDGTLDGKPILPEPPVKLDLGPKLRRRT